MAILLLSGCDWVLYQAIHREKSQPPSPQITESWASDVARPGDIWKIYLKAEIPDGEMKAIFSNLERTGVGRHPVSITVLKPDFNRQLNGYIHLNTSDSETGSNLINANFILRVKIQNTTGQFSNEVFFPLTLDPRFTQFPPPLIFFQENDLGPILVRPQPEPSTK